MLRLILCLGQLLIITWAVDGRYQFRKFDQLTDVSDFNQASNLFTDIYLQRKSCTSIGIKFRQPNQKDYGWMLDKFQCKLAEIQEHEGNIMEKWSWFQFQLDHTIKLKVPHTSVDVKKEISESKESEKDSRYKKLIKNANKIHRSVCAVLLRSQLSSKKGITEWCLGTNSSHSQVEDLEIFIIQKSKTKKSGKQLGEIKIQRIIREPASFYYQTSCVENQDWSIVLESSYEENDNVSYSRLLDQLMANPEKSKSSKVPLQMREYKS